MDAAYRLMKLDDYEEVFSLWKTTPGIGLSAADQKKNIQTFLQKNSDTCFVALIDGKIVGTILCGDDGRRGYMYHLVVAESTRKKGVGATLVKMGMEALQRHGIEKCHLFVYGDNATAIEFYQRLGWKERTELLLFSSPPLGT